MRTFTAALIFSVTLFASEPKDQRNAYPAMYEGGTLPLSHNKVKATLGGDAVIFEQGARRIAVPAKDIVRITCGNNIRRRFGAVVLDVVPLMRLGESETLYIGLTWTGGSATKAEALFRLSRDDYQAFLAALERLTGMKAVDTHQVPTVVRYEL
jgi:hypothetical protein